MWLYPHCGHLPPYDEIWQDLLTCYDGRSIQYDKQGNPVKYLGHTLTWEKGRQLKSFDGNTYTYNANGIRTSKTVDGVKHTYTLDGTKILREVWGSNTLIPLYDNEDSVCGILYNNVPYYFIKNLQGDVIAIVDKNAQTVARYSYDAWGAITNAITYTELTEDVDIAAINPFRYRGYYYDEEIGLYYLQSRYYDAYINSFINSDEINYISFSDTSLRCNLFSYCENKPLNNIDDFGNISFSVVTSFINSFLKAAKKIVDWAKEAVVGLIGVYTSLSWQDVSKIAKDIGRSSHTVKKSISSIVSKLTKIRHIIGKVALGIGILSMIASIGEKATRLGDIKAIIAECVVETMQAFIEWIFTKVLKNVLKFIPFVGSVLSLCAGPIYKLIKTVLLTTKKMRKMKNIIASKINTATYSLCDYAIVFFKQLA